MANSVIVYFKDEDTLPKKFEDATIKYETGFALIIDRYGNTTAILAQNIASITDYDPSRQPRRY